jgi:antitoxin component of MazEF toxin-antitoxin module
MGCWLKWFKSKVIYKKNGFVIREKRNGDWIVQIPKDIANSMNLYPGKEVNIIVKDNMITIESI